MNRSALLTRSAGAFALVAAAALSRLLPHPPNFTPVAALALFAGACLPSAAQAFAVPMAAMLASDLVLGFHDQMPAVYLCFALTVGLGRLIQERRRIVPLALAALSASLLFFAVTNLAVWVSGSLYPRTPAGLAECFVLALPFFGNTLLGDALCTAALFFAFAFVERLVPAAREAGAD
jgi:hypothetical protein